MPKSYHPASAISPTPRIRGLQDFGEILLRSDKGQGYIRRVPVHPDVTVGLARLQHDLAKVLQSGPVTVGVIGDMGADDPHVFALAEALA